MNGPYISPEAEAKPLADLGLSPRVVNALRSRGIERVGQVVLQRHGDHLRRGRIGVIIHLGFELLHIHMRVALELADPAFGRSQHARNRPEALHADGQRDEQQQGHDVENPARGLGQVGEGVERHDLTPDVQGTSVQFDRPR